MKYENAVWNLVRVPLVGKPVSYPTTYRGQMRRPSGLPELHLFTYTDGNGYDNPFIYAPATKECLTIGGYTMGPDWSLAREPQLVFTKYVGVSLERTKWVADSLEFLETQMEAGKIDFIYKLGHYDTREVRYERVKERSAK